MDTGKYKPVPVSEVEKDESFQADWNSHHSRVNTNIVKGVLNNLENTFFQYLWLTMGVGRLVKPTH